MTSTTCARRQAGRVPHRSPNKGEIKVPHPLDLFDPLGLSKNKSPDAKAKGLRAEINNGRLAQLSLFAFICEAKIPGSVPLLSGIVSPYAGEVMAPLAGHLPVGAIPLLSSRD
jgi:hypothetical protein